jgi:hypothetical protein
MMLGREEEGLSTDLIIGQCCDKILVVSVIASDVLSVLSKELSKIKGWWNKSDSAVDLHGGKML